MTIVFEYLLNASWITRWSPSGGHKLSKSIYGLKQPISGGTVGCYRYLTNSQFGWTKQPWEDRATLLWLLSRVTQLSWPKYWTQQEKVRRQEMGRRQCSNWRPLRCPHFWGEINFQSISISFQTVEIWRCASEGEAWAEVGNHDVWAGHSAEAGWRDTSEDDHQHHCHKHWTSSSVLSFKARESKENINLKTCFKILIIHDKCQKNFVQLPLKRKKRQAKKSEEGGGGGPRWNINIWKAAKDVFLVKCCDWPVVSDNPICSNDEIGEVDNIDDSDDECQREGGGPPLH